MLTVNYDSSCLGKAEEISWNFPTMRAEEHLYIERSRLLAAQARVRTAVDVVLPLFGVERYRQRDIL